MRNAVFTVNVIKPSDCVCGSGPADPDTGLPTILPKDLAAALEKDRHGVRYVFARVEVFPESLTTAWRSAPTTDIPAAVQEAFKHLGDALARLPWEN